MSEDVSNAAAKILKTYAARREVSQDRSTSVTESLCLAANVVHYRISSAHITTVAGETLKRVLDLESKIFSSLLSQGVTYATKEPDSIDKSTGSGDG